MSSSRLAASITLACALAIPIPTSAAEPAEPYERVADKAVLKVRAFEPADVRLLEGPFKKAFDDNTGFLLKVEPDRLLHRFLAYNGLAPKGELYGGWEAEGLSGHSLGHYLSACALAYAGSGDRHLLDRVTYIVDELARAQEVRDDGYVGGIPNQDALFRDIETGNFFNVRQNYINNFWAPWYTIHKIFAGLLDAHRYCRNEKALSVAERYGRWAARITRNLDDAAWQKMLYAEFGGMSESLSELYARTGDETFMGLARRFYHREVLEPLAEGQDKLNGFHANCQIPKVIGAARDYEVTANERGRRIAAFFWDAVIKNHTYANGGNSEAEYFGPPGVLSTRLTENTSETCNTYNMLKLTRHLFTWEPKVGYADYSERALFNHILASTEPATGMKCYYMPLAGMPKEYSKPFDSFWCCVGTGWENPARYTDSIYFHDAGTLYVNLFIASRLDWKEKAITVTQETRFPEEDVTRLKIGGTGARFALKVRHPFWAAGPVAVKLNGRPFRVTAKAGEYFAVDRDWKSGDVLEVEASHGPPHRSHARRSQQDLLVPRARAPGRRPRPRRRAFSPHAGPRGRGPAAGAERQAELARWPAALPDGGSRPAPGRAPEALLHGSSLVRPRVLRPAEQDRMGDARGRAKGGGGPDAGPPGGGRRGRGHRAWPRHRQRTSRHGHGAPRLGASEGRLRLRALRAGHRRAPRSPWS